MNKMMKPEMEVVRFGAEDIMTASGLGTFMRYKKGTSIEVYQGVDRNDAFGTSGVFVADAFYDSATNGWFDSEEIANYNTYTGANLDGTFDSTINDEVLKFNALLSGISFINDSDLSKKLSTINNSYDNYFEFREGAWHFTN